MFKKTVNAALALALVSFAGAAQAQSCGGTMMPNDDLNSGRYNYSCCPSGYRVQGIACADLPGQDLSDGCSAVCRSISKGNDMMPSNDFQRMPEPVTCPKASVFAGLWCKDVNKSGKGDDDVADGCSAICQDASSGAITKMSKGDIDGTNRPSKDLMVRLPQRVVGIACAEVDKGSSDRMDGCTIMYQ